MGGMAYGKWHSTKVGWSRRSLGRRDWLMHLLRIWQMELVRMCTYVDTYANIR